MALPSYDRKGVVSANFCNFVCYAASAPEGGFDFLSMPNHWTIKASTLRTILTQAGVARESLLRAYEQS
jgi:hypothetical protein